MKSKGRENGAKDLEVVPESPPVEVDMDAAINSILHEEEMEEAKNKVLIITDSCTLSPSIRCKCFPIMLVLSSLILCSNYRNNRYMKMRVSAKLSLQLMELPQFVLMLGKW